MHDNTARTSLHLILFTFNRRSLLADSRNLLLRRTTGRRILKTAPLLDRAKPIPSGSGQVQAPTTSWTTTGISRTADCGRTIRHLLSPSGFKAETYLSAPLGTYTLADAIIHSKSIPSPFGWRVRRSMSTTPTFSAYLLEQKIRFLGDSGEGWTIVTGNEAGDLDSLASSIAFAWLLSRIPTSDAKAIALITNTRDDFVLRAENLHALQLAGIRDDLQELLCPEDLPKPNLCTNLALVDHNKPHSVNALPGARVTAIIDHHEDEGKYHDTALPRIVEPAGSCASLVTRVIMSYPTLRIPPELVVLLLSAIVIDTHGLWKGGKAIDVDYEASAWLLPRTYDPFSQTLVGPTVETALQVPDNPWIQSLSDTLSAKKNTLSHLSTRDLLRRDYKEYDLDLSSSICGDSRRSIKAGLATVPLPLSSFFSPIPTSAVVATQKWIKERGLSVLGVLTHYKSKQGKPRRDFMWVVDENVCGHKLPRVLFDGLEANEILQAKRICFERYGFDSYAVEKENEGDGAEQGSIDEEPVGEQAEASPFGVGLVARVYRQKNSAVTRKQVAPIMKRVLEG